MADVTSTFTATGQSASIVPKSSVDAMRHAGFNVSTSGTWVGTVQLERRFSGGVTWHPLTVGATQLGIWTAPCSESFEETQCGVEYRLNCTAYTSGTIAYRIGY